MNNGFGYVWPWGIHKETHLNVCEWEHYHKSDKSSKFCEYPIHAFFAQILFASLPPFNFRWCPWLMCFKGGWNQQSSSHMAMNESKTTVVVSILDVFFMQRIVLRISSVLAVKMQWYIHQTCVFVSRGLSSRSSIKLPYISGEPFLWTNPVAQSEYAPDM